METTAYYGDGTSIDEINRNNHRQALKDDINGNLEFLNELKKDLFDFFTYIESIGEANEKLIEELEEISSKIMVVTTMLDGTLEDYDINKKLTEAKRKVDSDNIAVF